MIEFDAVSKHYPGGSLAVKNFSLTIPSHKTVVLLGSSGSGKTTLLRMINRMVDPSSGRVLIDDEDIAQRDPVQLRRSIGYVLQEGGLLPHRTVLDNIATVPRLLGTPKDEALSTAKRLLEQLGLSQDFGNRYPKQLSGGQQQRVGVARALASDPNILLMDEPFGAVDPIVRRELQDLLLNLQKELGKTLVFVTHDIDEAFRLGDQVVVLEEHAVIAQQGSPADIMSAPANDFVKNFIGDNRGDRILSTKQHLGRTITIDRDGRTIGVIQE
ncbi:MAG: ATP-binding cassette domain-containing protein [Microbacteriaceae bacterium]